MRNNISVLAVDDEEVNLDIMCEYFEDARFDSLKAHDGKEALEILDKGNHVDVIVLDRMMPNMNGMEFLQKIKESAKYKDIPVIMQTAASASHQVAEGIEAGVYYYLSKPYSKEVFLSLVKAANDDAFRKKELRILISQYGKGMAMIESGHFKFQTIEQAKSLAILLGSCTPDPEGIILGLTELMVNCVEHGSYGITYEEKKKLKLANAWDSQVIQRERDPRFSHMFCTVEVEKIQNEYRLKIQDQGKGFDWENFKAFNVDRLKDPNGRGILISQNCGFSSVEYQGTGNIVSCTVNLK